MAFGLGLLLGVVFSVALWYTAPGPTRDLHHQARITYNSPKLLKEDDSSSEDSIMSDMSPGAAWPSNDVIVLEDYPLVKMAVAGGGCPFLSNCLADNKREASDQACFSIDPQPVTSTHSFSLSAPP